MITVIKKGILVLAMIFVNVAATTVRGGYEIGDSVADFTLKNVDGRMVSLGDYEDAKGLIVVFDCNTCPYSKAYNGRIQALSEKYGPLGYPLIAINANDAQSSPGDSFEEMVARATKNKYDFPYLLDETQEVAKTFGATNTPHVFILQRSDNDLRVRYIGTIDNNARNAKGVTKRYVEDAVEALLAGKSVPVAKTKAIGCGIKYRDA